MCSYCFLEQIGRERAILVKRSKFLERKNVEQNVKLGKTKQFSFDDAKNTAGKLQYQFDMTSSNLSQKKQILTMIIFVNQNEKKKTCENQIQINSSRDLIISSDSETAVNSDSETNISSIHVEMK